MYIYLRCNRVLSGYKNKHGKGYPYINHKQPFPMQVLKIISLVFLLCYSPCFAVDQGHYEAAWELMTLAHETNVSVFLDTIVARITEKDSTLKEHRGEIYSIIRKYLRSDEYKELRINAIMHFFRESEIRELIILLRNPSFHNRTGEQVAIVKKYEKIFSGLEKEFIEHIKKKLRRKY